MELEFLAANICSEKNGHYSLGHLNLIDWVEKTEKKYFLVLIFHFRC